MRIVRLLATPKVTMVWTRFTERGDVAFTLPVGLSMVPGDTWLLTLGALQLRRNAVPLHDVQRIFGGEVVESPRVGVVPSLAVLSGVQMVVARAPAEIAYQFRSTRANFRAHLGLAAGDALFTAWQANPSNFLLRGVTDPNPNDQGTVDIPAPPEPTVDGTWRDGLRR